jgi:hypothetical protein
MSLLVSHPRLGRIFYAPGLSSTVKFPLDISWTEEELVT